VESEDDFFWGDAHVYEFLGEVGFGHVALNPDLVVFDVDVDEAMVDALHTFPADIEDEVVIIFGVDEDLVFDFGGGFVGVTFEEAADAGLVEGDRGVGLAALDGFWTFEFKDFLADDFFLLGATGFGVGEAVFGGVGVAAAEEGAKGGEVLGITAGVGFELGVGHGFKVGGGHLGDSRLNARGLTGLDILAWFIFLGEGFPIHRLIQPLRHNQSECQTVGHWGFSV
jgi:hypothetical protein